MRGRQKDRTTEKEDDRKREREREREREKARQRKATNRWMYLCPCLGAGIPPLFMGNANMVLREPMPFYTLI